MDRSAWTALGVTLVAVGVAHAVVIGVLVRRGLRDEVRRRVLRSFLAAYVLVTGTGLVIGLLVTDGPGGRRLAGAGLGIALAWLGCWFVAFVLLSARAAWRAAHLMRDAVPVPPPRPLELDEVDEADAERHG
jgi:hypothetical protein